MKFTYANGDTPLDGYTIKRGIGRGGFGEVYFGVSAHGKEVALKLIQANLEIELRGIGQCLNLKHPNLVHLYDLRIDGHGDHWLIMEYLAGESLSAILARNPAGVGTDLAAQWFQGLAAAVHHLHDHGIVHRDLKPGNIFLENALIKVGDYGLCKTMGQTQNLKQTQSVGTVHYMAPEISTGNYKHQVDIYAAGVILFELLTGHVPFDGESVVEILFKHQTERPDLSEVPAAFVPILDRALNKSPARRFPSINEMAKQVAAAVPSTTGAVAQPSAVAPAARTVRRRLEAPTQLFLKPLQRLPGVSGPLLGATLLAAVGTFIVGMLVKPESWRELEPLFFLTTLCCAAVLIPAKLWPGPADESWPRRLIFMALGVVIGLAAVFLDDAPVAIAGIEPVPKHRFFGLLYQDAGTFSVPLSYVVYFGVMFLALRWWKIGAEDRPSRLSGRAVVATAFWAYILLFLLPNSHQRREGFFALVLTSFIVQVVTPWVPREATRSKKLRLRDV